MVESHQPVYKSLPAKGKDGESFIENRQND